MSAPERCRNHANGLCGECDYCEGLLVTRPITSITPEEWTLIRVRCRRVNGLRPLLRVVAP